MQAAG